MFLFKKKSKDDKNEKKPEKSRDKDMTVKRSFLPSFLRSGKGGVKDAKIDFGVAGEVVEFDVQGQEEQIQFGFRYQSINSIFKLSFICHLMYKIFSL